MSESFFYNVSSSGKITGPSIENNWLAVGAEVNNICRTCAHNDLDCNASVEEHGWFNKSYNLYNRSGNNDIPKDCPITQARSITIEV